MALRNIRLDGDDILRKKSKPVTEISKRILQLLDDMADTMRSVDGAGLAAPQVGVLKRIVIIDVGDGIIELINPEIIEVSGSQSNSEGCLSIPGKTGIVERPAVVKVKYRDRSFEEHEIEGTENLAIALCHETDHLDGILYTDKATEMNDIGGEDEYA